MSISQQLAKHLRQVYTGGNWSSVDLTTTLADVTYDEAMAQVGQLNTIAKLTFHLNYYTEGLLAAFASGELAIRDKYSFDVPASFSANDWEALRARILRNGEQFATEIEAFDDERMFAAFYEEKYGNYFGNILGIIEHLHYHLGQIVVLKKMVRGG